MLVALVVLGGCVERRLTATDPPLPLLARAPAPHIPDAIQMTGTTGILSPWASSPVRY